MFDLTGKAALVTGASGGIGAEIARALHGAGAQVALHGTRVEPLEALAAELGERAHVTPANLSDLGAVEALPKAAAEAMGAVDILVNNAGITHRNQPMLDVEEVEYDQIFNVNVKAHYIMAKAVIPHFRKQGGGNILNIASTAGVRPRPGLVWYNASKAAVIGMTKAMAVELAGDNIRINAINPVAGETPLLEKFMGEDTPERRAAFKATVPMGRFSKPEDIANAAVYLVSDDANFITGVDFLVDGGRCI